MALIASAKGSQTTGLMNTTNAKLILVGVRNEGSPSFDVSDSASNTGWVSLPRQQSGNVGLGLRLAYKINPTTSAVHTFTNGMGVGYPIVAAAYDDLSPLFDLSFGENNGGGTTHTSLTVGDATNITPSQATTLLASVCMAYNSGANITGLTIATDGWTVPQYEDPGVAGVDLAIAFKYINPAVLSSAPWIWTTGGEGAGIIASVGYTAGSPPAGLDIPRNLSVRQAVARSAFY